DFDFLDVSDQKQCDAKRLVTDVVEHGRAAGELRIKAPELVGGFAEVPDVAFGSSDRCLDLQAGGAADFAGVDQAACVEQRLVEQAGFENLEDFAGLARDLDDLVGFFKGEGDGALDEYVFAGAQGIDNLRGMQIMRRENFYGVDARI